MPDRVCVFDAYGTLFDVAGAARAAAQEPGRKALAETWPRLAELWRRKQLEYAWLRTIMGEHADFWSITCDALDWTLDTLRIDDAELRTRLRELYLELPAYPEVAAMLQTLKDSGVPTAVLSNGAPDMLGRAVSAAGIAGLLDAVISVEEVGAFKPHRRVYDLVSTRFGVDKKRVLFASSNGWDAAGAAAYGFETVWVNRSGDLPERLPWKPARVIKNLSAIPLLAATL